VNDPNHIATQALQALQLRRQLEQGTLTHEEYVIRLNALQSGSVEPARPAALAIPQPPPESSVTSYSPSTERRPLMSALELLQLRRRLDNGQLTRQQYQAQLHTELQNQESTEKPALTHTPAPGATALTPPTSKVLADQAVPARDLSLKCPSCEADLKIYDQMSEPQCRDCGVDILVERKNGTVSLRLLEEEAVAPETDAPSNNTGELAKLQAEAAMLTTVKRVAGIVGFVSTVLFMDAGIAVMAAQRTEMATSVLFCGCALLGMVLCITRHTSNVRAQLTIRIRALSPAAE
jgi:hypothetical protein